MITCEFTIILKIKILKKKQLLCRFFNDNKAISNRSYIKFIISVLTWRNLIREKFLSDFSRINSLLKSILNIFSYNDFCAFVFRRLNTRSYSISHDSHRAKMTSKNDIVWWKRANQLFFRTFNADMTSKKNLTIKNSN